MSSGYGGIYANGFRQVVGLVIALIVIGAFFPSLVGYGYGAN